MTEYIYQTSTIFGMAAGQYFLNDGIRCLKLRDMGRSSYVNLTTYDVVTVDRGSEFIQYVMCDRAGTPRPAPTPITYTDAITLRARVSTGDYILSGVGLAYRAHLGPGRTTLFVHADPDVVIHRPEDLIYPVTRCTPDGTPIVR